MSPDRKYRMISYSLQGLVVYSVQDGIAICSRKVQIKILKYFLKGLPQKIGTLYWRNIDINGISTSIHRCFGGHNRMIAECYLSVIFRWRDDNYADDPFLHYVGP